MSKIPAAPEYEAVVRHSRNMVNPVKEHAKIDGVMAQVEVLTNIVNQLVAAANAKKATARSRAADAAMPPTEE